MGKLTDIVQSQINAAREEQRLSDAKEKANWQYRQSTLNSAAQLQAGIITTGLEKGVNRESLIQQTNKMVEQLANAKIRLGTADGPYEGSEWDEKFVSNTQSEIARIGDTFSALLYVDEEYNKIMQNKGVGNAEGMIDMSQTDPFFAIAQDIGNPNMDTQGKVSWEWEYSEDGGGEWFRVTEGPAVEEMYKKLYKETGSSQYLNADGSIKTKHKTSYTENKNALDNANGDENNYGNQMATVPGLSGMNKQLQDLKIMGDDNLLSRNLFETSQRVSSNGIDVYDKQVPRYNDIKRSIQSFTNAEVNLIAGSLNDGSGVSFLNSRAANIAGMRKDSEGMLEMEVPREEGGEFVVDNDGNLVMETVKFGSPGLKGGRYVRDHTKDRSATKGYEQEDWNNLKRAYLWIKMSEMKATKPGKEEINRSESANRKENYKLFKEDKVEVPEFKEWQFKAYGSYQSIKNAMETLYDYSVPKSTPFSINTINEDKKEKEKLANDFKNILKSKIPNLVFKIEGDKVVMKTPRIVKEGGVSLVQATDQSGNLQTNTDGTPLMTYNLAGTATYNTKEIETNTFDINKPEKIEKFLINYLIGYNPVNLFPGIDAQLNTSLIDKGISNYLDSIYANKK